MSAELLRRAAALMRERAQAATPGPWAPSHEHPSPYRPPDTYDVEELGSGLPHVISVAFGDSVHIAAADPPFMLTVADLLDHAGARIEEKVKRGGNEAAVWSHERDAFAVARAYIGDES